MSDSNAVTKHAEAPAALAQPSEIGAMLHLAIERGIDVEALERLQAMYERDRAQVAEREFHAALARFQAACPPIVTRTETQQYTKVDRAGVKRAGRYAAMEDIIPFAGPALSAEGLSWSWDSVEDGQSKLTTTCTLWHQSGHSRTSSFACPTETKGNMSAQQRPASAYTFGRRQTFIAVTGIVVVGEDGDGFVGSSPASPTGGARVSDEQRAELLELASPLDSSEFDACLEWLGVTAFAELPSSLYARAKRGIEAKVAAKKAKGGAA